MTLLSTNELYSREFDRAADALHHTLLRDPQKFHNAVGEPFMWAFKPPAKRLNYILAPERVTEECRRHTEAARALHSIWTQFHRDDAQLSGWERALAKHLDAEVQDYIETTAADEAEGGLETVQRARRSGL